MKTNCPVIWTSNYQQEKKGWTKWLIGTNLVWIIISLFLYFGWMGSKPNPQISNINEQLKNYKVRDELFNILRVKGYSLSQGIDIASALIVHSRENRIPLEMGLGIIKQESWFYINAIGNPVQTPKGIQKAMGLMQLMPDTFDYLNKKLKLGLERHAAFDPIINIRFGLTHLRDTYDELGLKYPKNKEEDLWGKALNAYSGGAKNYPEAVRRFQKEFEVKLRDGEI